MDCINWVPSTAGAAVVDATTYTRYAEGSPVKFWWFDGRDISNTVTFATESYDKIVSAEVTLVYDATAPPSTGAFSLVAGATALVYASIMLSL